MKCPTLLARVLGGGALKMFKIRKGSADKNKRLQTTALWCKILVLFKYL